MPNNCCTSFIVITPDFPCNVSGSAVETGIVHMLLQTAMDHDVLFGGLLKLLPFMDFIGQIPRKTERRHFLTFSSEMGENAKLLYLNQEKFRISYSHTSPYCFVSVGWVTGRGSGL